MALTESNAKCHSERAQPIIPPDPVAASRAGPVNSNVRGLLSCLCHSPDIALFKRQQSSSLARSLSLGARLANPACSSGRAVHSSVGAPQRLLSWSSVSSSVVGGGTEDIGFVLHQSSPCFSTDGSFRPPVASGAGKASGTSAAPGSIPSRPSNMPIILSSVAGRCAKRRRSAAHLYVRLQGMQRPLLASMVLLLVASAEAVLLSLILSHPASSGAVAPNALTSLIVWACLPLAGAAGVVWLSFARAKPTPVRSVLLVSLVGLIAGFLALRQYSHAAPGFLVFAFVAQCIVVCYAFAGAIRRAT